MSGQNHFVNQAMDVVDETKDIELNPINRDDTARQESVPLLFAAINSGNIEGVRSHLDLTTDHINSTSYGGLTPLHAACHMQQLDILKFLLSRGAKVNSFDSLGNTSLHVAIREKWCDGIQALLEQGASPNKMSEPPANVSGQLRETPMHSAVRTGTMTYVTLLLRYKPDLSIRDRNNHTIFHLAAATRNLLILKQLLMEPASPKIIESAGKETESLYHAALPLNAKIENESQILKVIQVVHKCSDNINVVNLHGETPLYLACRLGLPNVVDFLLKKGAADPVLLTHEKQSTLHAACIAGCGQTLKHLFDTSKVSSLITEPDNDGSSPFYFAVEASSIECCRILLNNGEHLTNICKDETSNCTLVMSKLPSAMQLFRELLDSSVTLNKKSEHDPDFSITFDYSVLMSSERAEMQSSIASELSGTTLEHLIKHPLLESFLFFKWGRIKDIFYYNVIQYFLYVILHTVFVLMTYGERHIDWKGKNEAWLLGLKITHWVLIILISVPAAIVTVANLKNILRQWETYTRLCAIALSFYVVLITEGEVEKLANDPAPKLEVREAVASASVFFVWMELMMLLGRFPALGTYILMLTKVSKSVIKFIMAFLSLIIGFSLCFHILFQKMPVFRNYSLSFAKTVMMMTGEIAYSEFVDNKVNMPFNIFGQIVITFFVFLVTIIMSNLLIGLAVNDIPQLERQGNIKRLVKQASYVMAYERVLCYLYTWRFFPDRVRALLSSRCSLKCLVTVMPNKKKVRSFYFHELHEETIREAITLGNCASSEDFQPSVADDVSHQLKGFQMRYSNDRRTQKHKFEELSVMCGDIKKEMGDLQGKIDTKLDKITDLLNEQVHQTQNAVNQLMQRQSVPGRDETSI